MSETVHRVTIECPSCLGSGRNERATHHMMMHIRCGKCHGTGELVGEIASPQPEPLHQPTLDRAIQAVEALRVTLAWKNDADHIGHGEGLEDALQRLRDLKTTTQEKT
jgi:hypothetical protein